MAAFFDNTPPREGRDLYLWAKQVEHDYQVGMLRYLRRFAKPRGWSWRIVDWEPDEVTEAYTAAAEALKRYRR